MFLRYASLFDGQPQIAEVKGHTVRIGSALDNDIVISGPFVDKYAVVLSVKDKQCSLLACGGNGCETNGKVLRLLLTPVVTEAILSLSGISTFVVVCWGIYRVLLIQLQAKVDARRRQIRRLLPHALDSLAMTLSAGGTFPEACHDLARDFPDHPLAMEFSRMLTEIQRGQTSHRALAALAQRIDVPEFHEIIRTMTITVEHGTPAAEFFRLSAQKIRYSQLKQMETAIGVAEAKMPLPTFVIMVACMLVAIAPFAVTAINSGFLETIGAYAQGR